MEVSRETERRVLDRLKGATFRQNIEQEAYVIRE